MCSNHARVEKVAGLPGAGLPCAGLPGAGLPCAGLPGAGLPCAGLLCVGLLCAALLSCSGGATPIGAFDVAGDPVAGADAREAGTGPDEEAVVSERPEVMSDPREEEVAGGDVREEAWEGGPHWPCSDNQECQSGWCIESPDGKECAAVCASDAACDPGYQCAQVASYPDVAYACVHAAPRTCRPCKDAPDCDAGYATTRMSCVVLGDRAFCLRACGADGTCPEGFSCQEPERTCLPVTGTCACSQSAVAGGYEGLCFNRNADGECQGQFVCMADGPGPCAGPVPAAETCNATDDDCDGQVDEGFIAAGPCDLVNEHGTCQGTSVCQGGEAVCQGTAAAPEVCNGADDDCDGVTDEGAPDLDLDGIADCWDCDADGDGVENPSPACGACGPPCDVCPLVWDASQADLDGDGEGDACDPDDDGDGVIDAVDNCPLTPNTDQKDTNLDGEGDACSCDIDGDGIPNPAPGCPVACSQCDNCPSWPNPTQEDRDLNGVGDACDVDIDGDKIANDKDNCVKVANLDQGDADHDGQGDACDCDQDGDGAPNQNPGCPDCASSCDNCLLTRNPDQSDLDADGQGDACDPDKDGDGVGDLEDNCPGTPNPGQEDGNDNGVGDACEADWDGDGVANGDDDCPWVFNPRQDDLDLDTTGDACDCDIDGDGVPQPGPGPDNAPCPDPGEGADVCPEVPDPGQADLDKDGAGDACDPDRDGDADPNGADCAPDDGQVHHGAAEACNGRDDDCDGATDEADAAGCTVRYRDDDGDGFGSLVAKCLCAAEAPFIPLVSGDCDDQDTTANPAAPEVCGDFEDDDCDGKVDEPDSGGCVPFHKDADGDGYGQDADFMCLCQPWGQYSTRAAGDCNDAEKTISPAAVESCNGRDDDCDLAIDPEGSAGCKTYLADRDRDGFGDPGDARCLCTAGEPYDAVKGGDCDDADPEAHPGGVETCDGADEDCDGVVDEEGAGGCQDRYYDGDGDGWGASAARCLCGPKDAWTAAKPGDCNDGDAAVNPEAAEACNGHDDDCDAAVDEEGANGCVDRFFDGDADGHGDGSDRKCLCGVLGQFTAPTGDDCDDLDKTRYPGALEVCDGEDDDCDGVADEEGAANCARHYLDADGDGHGLAADWRCLCGPDGEYNSLTPDDCDDKEAGVYPGATEACNGRDDDCDHATDEEGAVGCVEHYYDNDQDGYGSAAHRCLCGPAAPYSALAGGDCDDNDAAVKPGATEVCNGVDDNCNQKADEERTAGGCGADGYETLFFDQDHDTWGTAASKCLCGPWGFYSAGRSGDCSDANPLVYPDATEVCNTVDDDCDGQVDEGVTSPCGGCNTVCSLPSGPVGGGEPFEPGPENSSGVSLDPGGNVVLNSSKIEMPFIWIANSGEGTVSKLNTKTGCEVARYSVCSDPSRTAVDLNGNGIITCRGDGKVVKVAVFTQDCKDANGNGKIDTSTDLDGNCVISAAERVANDECVLWTRQFAGYTGTRAAGVDKDNNIWVGWYYTPYSQGALKRLAGTDGADLQTIPVPKRTYGLAIDQTGVIWVSGRDDSPSALVRVDPKTAQVNAFTVPNGYGTYGIAVDYKGKVWVAAGEGINAGGVYRFDPAVSQFTHALDLRWQGNHWGYTRGVAISQTRDQSGNITGGKVYVAHNTYNCTADWSSRKVSVVDVNTIALESPIDLGKFRGPTGVAIDTDGFLWTVNMCEGGTSVSPWPGSASKINTATKTVVATYPVGSQPYTYSDMTGYAARTVTAPSGYYRQVFDGWEGYETSWNLVYVEGETPGAGKSYFKVRFRTAATVAGLKDQPWSAVQGPYPPALFPLDLKAASGGVEVVGNHLEVEVTLATDDANYIPRLRGITVVASAK